MQRIEDGRRAADALARVAAMDRRVTRMMIGAAVVSGLFGVAIVAALNLSFG